MVISEVMRDNPHLSGDDLRKAVSDAYPFGERRMFPYKAWLKAVEQVLGPSQKKIEAVKKKREELKANHQDDPSSPYQLELPEVCK